MARSTIPFERLHGLTKELRRRGIDPYVWPTIREYVESENLRTEEELDAYLDQMEIHRGGVFG